MFSHTFGSSSDAGKSRLSQTRMFTLQTLKFKEVMNKERMNAMELLLYLWLFFCHYMVPAVYALGRVNRDINEGNECLNKLASF